MGPKITARSHLKCHLRPMFKQLTTVGLLVEADHTWSPRLTIRSLPTPVTLLRYRALFLWHQSCSQRHLRASPTLLVLSHRDWHPECASPAPASESKPIQRFEETGRVPRSFAVAASAMAHTTARFRGCLMITSVLVVCFIGAAYAKDDARPVPGCTGKTSRRTARAGACCAPAFVGPSASENHTKRLNHIGA